MIILLTGPPGIGKTTAIMKAVEALKARKGLKIGGMITREVREGGKRVGFQIVDLVNNRTGWLAHINQPEGPKISKYRVNLRDLEEIGVKALEDAIKEADLIICDEIGPMELISKKFREVVKKLANSGKPVLGTIHYKLSESLIEELKECPHLKVIKMTFTNRDFIPFLLFKEVSKLVK